MLFARWPAGQTALTIDQSPLYPPFEAIPHRNRLIEPALAGEVNIDFQKTPHEAIAKLCVMAGTEIFLDPVALQTAQFERENRKSRKMAGPQRNGPMRRKASRNCAAHENLLIRATRIAGILQPFDIGLPENSSAIELTRIFVASR